MQSPSATRTIWKPSLPSLGPVCPFALFVRLPTMQLLGIHVVLLHTLYPRGRMLVPVVVVDSFPDDDGVHLRGRLYPGSGHCRAALHRARSRYWGTNTGTMDKIYRDFHASMGALGGQNINCVCLHSVIDIIPQLTSCQLCC